LWLDRKNLYTRSIVVDIVLAEQILQLIVQTIVVGCRGTTTRINHGQWIIVWQCRRTATRGTFDLGIGIEVRVGVDDLDMGKARVQ